MNSLNEFVCKDTKKIIEQYVGCFLCAYNKEVLLKYFKYKSHRTYISPNKLENVILKYDNYNILMRHEKHFSFIGGGTHSDVTRYDLTMDNFTYNITHYSYIKETNKNRKHCTDEICHIKNLIKLVTFIPNIQRENIHGT